MIWWFEKRNKLSWIITFLIAIAIFYISSLSFQPSPRGDIYSKLTLYHFFAFFFLALFLEISLLKGKRIYFLLFLAVLISAMYGITDELHQLFVPGRFCSVSNFLTNLSGIIIASLSYSVTLEYRK